MKWGCTACHRDAGQRYEYRDWALVHNGDLYYVEILRNAVAVFLGDLILRLQQITLAHIYIRSALGPSNRLGHWPGRIRKSHLERDVSAGGGEAHRNECSTVGGYAGTIYTRGGEQ